MIQVDVPIEFFLFIWFGVWAFLTTTICLSVAWAYFDHKRSKVGKIADKAKNTHSTLNLCASDDGHVSVDIIKKVDPAGDAKTSKHKWVGFFPRSHKVKMPELDIEKLAQQDPNNEQLRKALEAYKESKQHAQLAAPILDELNTKKAILQEDGIPIVVSYKGKAIFSSIFGLAGLEAFQQASDIQTHKQTLPNGAGEAKMGYLNIDMQAIKSLFGKSWDEVQQEARDIKSETVGFKKGKARSNDKWWIWLIPIATLVVGLIMGYFMAKS